MSVVQDRLKRYEDSELDAIMLYIKSGTIKCGRFSHLVKVDPKKKMKGKVFFSDGHEAAADADNGKG